MKTQFRLAFAAFALVGIGLLSCDSTSSNPKPSGPQTLVLEFGVDAPHKNPETGIWREGSDSGAATFVASGTSFQTTITIPSPLGAQTLWLDVYAAGIREMRLPYLADNNGVVSLNKSGVVFDSTALALLAKIDSVKPALARTRSGALDLYAAWLLASDRRASGFPARCPIGLAPAEVIVRALQLAARDSESIADAAKTWSLAITADSATKLGLSLLITGALKSADSAALFPPAPVRMVQAVGLENASLVAGSSESALHGLFAFTKGSETATLAIFDAAGKSADSSFRWRAAKPMVGAKSWDLSEASLVARPGAAAGVYQVSITARDGRGDSARATFALQVTIPPRPLLAVAGIPSDLAFPEDSSVHVVLKLAVWHGDSVSVGLRSRDEQLMASGTRRLKPSPDSTLDLVLAPVANANGANSITLVLRDSLDSLKSTIALSVAARNDAPSFATSKPSLQLVSGVSTLVPQWATQIVAGPVDEKAQLVRFEVRALSGGDLFAEPVALDASGNLTAKPKPRLSGVASFQVRAHENGDSTGGNLNVGPWVPLRIDLNAAPTLSLPHRDTSVWENITTDLAVISLYDLETSVGNLAFAAKCSDSTLLPSDSIGIFANGATRKISLHPVAGKWGTCLLRLEVRDTAGGVAQDSIRVTVRHVNRTPVITAPPVVYASALGYGVATKVTLAYSASMGSGDASQKLTYSVALRDAVDAALFTTAPSLDSQKLAFVAVVPGADTVWLRLRAKDDGGTEHGGVDTAWLDVKLVFTDTVVDARDGRVYHFRRIGTQTWMTENSRWTPPSGVHWMNADSAQGQIYQSAHELHLGTTCDWPSGQAPTCQIHEVDAPCPTGWRLSSESDWQALSKFASGSGSVAQGLLRLFANNKFWWESSWTANSPPDTVFVSATDDMGFHLKPNGMNGGSGPEGGMEYPVFQIAFPNVMENANQQFLQLSSSFVNFPNTSPKGFSLPVRCMR